MLVLAVTTLALSLGVRAGTKEDLSTVAGASNLANLQIAARGAVRALYKTYTTEDLAQGWLASNLGTPWWHSAVAWSTILDYGCWSGDKQFDEGVVAALKNMATVISTADKGKQRWNEGFRRLPAGPVDDDVINSDDIAWAASAWATAMSRGLLTDGAIVRKTLSQMFDRRDLRTQNGVDIGRTNAYDAKMRDDKCGVAGSGKQLLYWKFNRADAGGGYKSTITNLQFVSLAAHCHSLAANGTLLDEAVSVLDALTDGPAKLLPTDKNRLYDGADSVTCERSSARDWSYNYGKAISSFHWLNKAGRTGYLGRANALLDYSLTTLAGADNIITEQCEVPTLACTMDDAIFKGIWLRDVAAFYSNIDDIKPTADRPSLRTRVKTAIDTSVAAAVQKCAITGTGDNERWDCPSIWTPNKPIYAPGLQSQLVAASLFVSAMGIQTDGGACRTKPVDPPA